MRKKTTSWYSNSSLEYWELISFLAGLCLMAHSPFSNKKISLCCSDFCISAFGFKWWYFQLFQVYHSNVTSKSFWINIHPLQRVVVFNFENHFDLIGTVSLGAECREKTHSMSPKNNIPFTFIRQLKKTSFLVWTPSSTKTQWNLSAKTPNLSNATKQIRNGTRHHCCLELKGLCSIPGYQGPALKPGLGTGPGRKCLVVRPSPGSIRSSQAQQKEETWILPPAGSPAGSPPEGGASGVQCYLDQATVKVGGFGWSWLLGHGTSLFWLGVNLILCRRLRDAIYIKSVSSQYTAQILKGIFLKGMWLVHWSDSRWETLGKFGVINSFGVSSVYWSLPRRTRRYVCLWLGTRSRSRLFFCTYFPNSGYKYPTFLESFGWMLEDAAPGGSIVLKGGFQHLRGQEWHDLDGCDLEERPSKPKQCLDKELLS